MEWDDPALWSWTWEYSLVRFLASQFMVAKGYLYQQAAVNQMAGSITNLEQDA